jgi:hypothetical protein
MADIIEQEEDVQSEQNDRAWDALEQEIEIVDEEDVEETPEEDSVSVEELKAKLAKYEDSEPQNQSNEQLAGALGELGTVLKDLKNQGSAATPQQKQEVQESLEAVKKRLSDKYYDAPLDSVDEYVKALLRQELGPVLGQFATRLNETTKGFTRQKVEQKDTGKFVLENYSEEVEKLVSSQNMDYEQAVKQVSANHLDEIIEEKVKNAMESRTDVNVDDEPKARNKNPQKTQGARPPTSKERIVIPRRVRQQLEDEADQRGIEVDRYIRYIKDNQPERLKGGK